MTKQEWGLVSLGALLLAMVMTWPLVTHIGSGLPYNERFVSPAGSDNHIWVWDFWWVKEALLSGQSPFTTDLILPPLENGLGLHTHVILYGVLGLPLTLAFGAPAAVGLVMLLLFASAFVAAWWLARTMGISRLGAFVVAFGWAFAPFFIQKATDHLSQVASPWPPLIVGCLVLALQRPTWGRIAGFFGALACATYVGPLFAVQAVILALATWLVRPSAHLAGGDLGEPSRWRLFAHQAFLPSALLALLVVWPAVHAVQVETESGRRFAEYQSAELGLPPEAFSITGRDVLARASLGSFLAFPEYSVLGQQDLTEVPGGNEISALHVSAALIVLALLGLVLVRGRGAWRWGLLAGAFLLIAWDPVTPWGALSDAYRKLPLADGYRVPSRFLPNALIGLLLLAGAGFDQLRRSQAGKPGRALPPLLIGLLVLTYWTRPLPMMSTVPPTEIQALGAPQDPRDFVLTLPSQFGASESMTWQTYHERGAVISFLARPNPWSILAMQESLPDLYSLIVPQLDPHGRPALPDPLGLLQDLQMIRVRTIVLDTKGFGVLEALVEPVTDYFDELRGWHRVNEAGQLLVWRRNE